MKNRSLVLLPVLVMAAMLISGCEAIGSIFKAGMWTATIGIVLIVAVIIFIVSKLFSKNKNG